jgi:mono/diheme cytochrome c family protein
MLDIGRNVNDNLGRERAIESPFVRTNPQWQLKKTMRYISLILLLLSLVATLHGDESHPLSPCDILLDREGTHLYLLEKDAMQLRVRAKGGKHPDETLPLPIEPVRMTFLPDEKIVAVVGGIGEGKLLLIRVRDDDGQPTSPSLEKSFFAGHSPSDAAAARRDGELRFYVADRFAGQVREIDGKTGETLRVFEGGREPIALKVTPDQKTLVVANLLPEHRADTSFTTSRVRLIDLESGSVTPINLYNGTANLYDLDISPDGRFAIVSGTNANYQTVTSQVIDGWIVNNIISVIDIPAKKFVKMIPLDNTHRGAPNPWGVAFGKDGKYIAIALSGSGEVLFLSVESLMAIIRSKLGEEPPSAETRAADPLRYRVQTGLRGTRRLVLRGNTVWVIGYYDDAIAKVTLDVIPPYGKPYFDAHTVPEIPDTDLAEKNARLANDTNAENTDSAWIPLPSFSPRPGIEFTRAFMRLGPKPPETILRRGEYLLSDALYCEEHWQSCITCHPEGRVDALSWDLENDGVGNPKNTKSLLYAHETPPSMITGVRADAETAVRAGVKHILFGSLPEEDYIAMDEYLKSLRPVPSPHLEAGELSRSARRGKILFESSRTRCASCHPEPFFTDLSMHATGSQDFNEPRTRFDTPTLCEVWRTAPYLSTGHWTTVREMLIEGKHGNRDGLLDELSPEELDDLIEYVLSL